MSALPFPQLEIRRARANDEPTLFDIHKAALGDYVRQTWGWDEDWQRDHFRTTFSSAGLRVIECDGQIAGMLQTANEGVRSTLVNIELAPAWQRRGIGSAIIRNFIDVATRRTQPVRLQVLRVNNRARRLYERLGFVMIGETTTHIQMERPCSAAGPKSATLNAVPKPAR